MRQAGRLGAISFVAVQVTKVEFVINLRTAKSLGLHGGGDAARPRRRGDRIGTFFVAVHELPITDLDDSPPMQTSKQPTDAEVKFSKKRLALAFAIAAISDAIGAFATPLPPIVWVVDLVTALLLFLVLGRQWLLLPGLALEAIPGFGVLPFWLLVVGAIAVLGTPRPTLERR